VLGTSRPLEARWRRASGPRIHERDHQRPAREHGRRDPRCAAAARVLARTDEREDALVDVRRGDALERQAIETALATVYALMTGDIAHPSDVVARDLNPLARAQQAPRTAHHPPPALDQPARFTATLNGPATSALARLMSCGAPPRSSGRGSSL